MPVVISISIIVLLSISLPSLYHTTSGTGRPVMLQLSLTFSPAFSVTIWSGDHSISGATVNAKRTKLIQNYHNQNNLECYFDLTVLTALICGHDVSRGVRWWTDCANSIPGDHSELKSVSRGQTGHSELCLTDISEVAAQPFSSALTPLYTVGHNLAATVSLGNIPLQGHRVPGYVNAHRCARWI